MGEANMKVQLSFDTPQRLQAVVVDGDLLPGLLPEGHAAVIHEAPFHPGAWIITHLESGNIIGAGSTRDFAIISAKKKLQSVSKHEREEALMKAIRNGKAYRGALWEAAQKAGQP